MWWQSCLVHVAEALILTMSSSVFALLAVLAWQEKKLKGNCPPRNAVKCISKSLTL